MKDKEHKLTRRNKDQHIVVRIIRVLSFAIILVTSVFILVKLLLSTSLANNTIFLTVKNFFNELPLAVVNYLELGFIIAIVILIWVRGKTIFGKILTTLLSGYVLLLAFNDVRTLLPYQLLAPSFLSGVNLSFLNFISDINEYLPYGIVLLTFIIISGILGNKPKRISARLVKGGFVFIIFGMVVVFATGLLALNSEAMSTLDTVVTYIYAIAYALCGLGGALGVLGFYRKR